MEEKKIETVENQSIFRSLWFAIKRNIILILVVLLLASGSGLTYASLVKPTYTAGVEVRYMIDDQSQGAGTYEDFDAMHAFITTVRDFVDEGVVLDRASYYYTRWLDAQDSYENIDEFIKATSLNDNYNVQMKMESHYERSKIRVSSAGENGQESFFFTISYVADTKKEASDKVKVLVFAYERELQSKDSQGKYVYFYNLDVEMDAKYTEGQDIPASSNVSKKNILLMAIMIGVVLSAGIIFLKEKLDNSVKSRKELEELTDTKVLALINK